MTVVAIVGPTAAGKSALAMRLAAAIGGEIVNTDAMQVYRGMDIGTAKPTPAEQAAVPHHLIDLWEIDHPVAVAEFQQLARAAIAEARGRGVPVVLVGGSGLYVDAVTDDLRFPPTDASVRQRWQDRLDESGAAALHAELARLDPAAAVAILPSNGRRLVRALEVIELTGGPFTATLPQQRTVVEHVRIGVTRPRPELDERIAARVERMWADGLVEEVRRLLPGLRDAPTASRALGYAQVIALLDGEIDDTTARERTAAATRRFARRQQSWFGRDDRVAWLAPSDDAVGAALALLPPTLTG